MDAQLDETNDSMTMRAGGEECQYGSRNDTEGIPLPKQRSTDPALQNIREA